jgi:soluble lytic murein transglycosylase
MRVAESLPVYRARLGLNDTGPVRFTEELRGTPPLPQDVAPPDQP